jgi:hypothetical protein
MTREALNKVVQRSIGDAAFRRQLATDASGALRGYDLTADEINAMQTRDVTKLTAFGVDVRMSKVFTLDPGMGGSASVATGEPRDVAPVWIGDYAPLTSVAGNGYATDEGQLTNGVPEGAALTAGNSMIASEPRDIAPVWIGETSVDGGGHATDEGQLTNGLPEGNGGEMHITTAGGDLDQ